MSEETADIPELEPMAAATPTSAPQPVKIAIPGPRASVPGLAPPAFHPSADKEYYRFLLAGVIMFIGCLMPFGPEWGMSGYKTLSGAFFMLIAIGMIWSWWGAIHTARFSGRNLRWVALCIIPLVVELLNLVGAFNEPAVHDLVVAQSSALAANPEARVAVPIATSWGEVFDGMMSPKDPVATGKVGNFFRAFGTGKLVVFLGALLAELFMILAVFGGAKTAKAQKAAKASERAGKGSKGSARRR